MRSYFVLLSLLLLIGSVCGRAQNLTSSNLPIIVIDTQGQPIQDDPKIEAHMGIIYNGISSRSNMTDAFNIYDGKIAIETRGNSSQMFEKMPYGFETRDALGGDAKVSLLGLPPESDWILAAAYIDKTLLRDPLAYELSRRMGNWASRTIHCELVLNGQYQGVYILEEKIKRDQHRVDIEKLEPEENSGADLSGGYIFEVAQSGDGFDKRRRYVYPKSADITIQQSNYIKSYDDAFRDMIVKSGYDDPITGYPAWIDVLSFIDEILIQELSKNSDAYGWSSYFHKDKDGKLKAGPAWDFDQGFSNSTFNNGPNYSEWLIQKSITDNWLKENYPPFWIRLFQEKEFKKQLRLRWTSLREDQWSTENIMSYIDSTAQHLNEAQQRNFQRWDILGKYIWRSTAGADVRNTYQKEVDNLKQFLTNRLGWMDSQLKLVITDVADEPHNGQALRIAPNPFSGKTTLYYNHQQGETVIVGIFDALGKQAGSFTSYDTNGDGEIAIDVTGLNPGLYHCMLRTSDGKTSVAKMILQR
jgi:hypothetical protein